MASAYTISPAVDADFPALFAALSDSFGDRHAFIESFYPEHQTTAGRVAGAKRLLSFSKADPLTHFVKCVDEQGNLAGFSKWNIWVDIPPTFPDEQAPWAEGVWDPEPFQSLGPESSELARWTLQRYIALRLGARKASGGRLVSLDLMCVSPGSQRKGVGQALMQWGVEKADEHGLEAVVEASDEGKGLYEKFGFKALRHVVLKENSGRFGGKEGQEFWWMVRPVGGKGQISAGLLDAAKEMSNGEIVDTGRS